MHDLQGKTAFVTGGDSGIGLGIAEALLGSGAEVIICGLAQDSLDAAKAQIGQKGTLHTVVLDVRDRAGFARTADWIDDEFGGLDVLVNNAGVGFLNPVVDASFEQWDWVIDINLTGSFNGIRTFLPRMLLSGRSGHIVSTSSIGGMLGAPGAVYAAAKFGVVGLTEALRSELRGTRVSASVLCPGIVRTHIADGPLPPGENERIKPGGTSVDSIYQTPMEPIEVGRLVTQGILNDDLYIFTHAEHHDLLEKRFDAILRSVPTNEPAASRANVERAVLANPMYDEVLSRTEVHANAKR